MLRLSHAITTRRIGGNGVNGIQNASEKMHSGQKSQLYRCSHLELYVKGVLGCVMYVQVISVVCVDDN